MKHYTPEMKRQPKQLVGVNENTPKEEKNVPIQEKFWKSRQIHIFITGKIVLIPQ